MFVLCVPENHDLHLLENYTLRIVKPIKRGNLREQIWHQLCEGRGVDSGQGRPQSRMKAGEVCAILAEKNPTRYVNFPNTKP